MLRYGDRMKLVMVNLPHKYTEREDPRSFLTLMFSDRDLSDEQVRAALAQTILLLQRHCLLGGAN